MKYAKFLQSAAFCLLLCTAIISGFCPAAALAADRIDLDRPIALNISYRVQDGETIKTISNADFSLYLVAAADEWGNLTASEAFSEYFTDIRGNNDEAWRTQATTLEGYVLRDKITATDSGKTDSEGNLDFPATQSRLTAGLYLLIGDKHKQGNHYYEAAPSLILLPYNDKETQDWVYTAEIAPKCDISKTSNEGGGGSSSSIKRKALKVWQDEGHEAARPQAVTVQLLRDGEVYDTVTLTDETNWRYTWDGLSDSSKWTLVEKATAGYTGTVTRDGITFVVTNTYSGNGGTPPSDSNNPPDGNSAPPDTETSQPNEPVAPTIPTTPTVPTLPQTGQLWWPVPIMLCGGAILIMLGLLHRRNYMRGNQNEQ